MLDLVHALFLDNYVVHAMAKSGGEGQGNFLLQMAPFAAVFAIVYFIMIRPQINQQKNHSTMLNNLKKGDNVVTQGGIIGNITNFKGKDNQIVVLDVNNNKIDILKNCIKSLHNKK